MYGLCWTNDIVTYCYSQCINLDWIDQTFIENK